MLGVDHITHYDEAGHVLSEVEKRDSLTTDSVVFTPSGDTLLVVEFTNGTMTHIRECSVQFTNETDLTLRQAIDVVREVMGTMLEPKSHAADTLCTPDNEWLAIHRELLALVQRYLG